MINPNLNASLNHLESKENKQTSPKRGRAREVRPLKFWDLKQVHEVAEKAFPKAWTEKDFAYFLSHQKGFGRGYFVNDVLVSYWLGLLIKGHWDIASVATDPKFQRQGICELVFLEALQTPMNKIFLEVASPNTKAIRLYKKLGFRKLRIRPRYYHNHEDALEMMWERDETSR